MARRGPILGHCLLCGEGVGGRSHRPGTLEHVPGLGVFALCRICRPAAGKAFWEAIYPLMRGEGMLHQLEARPLTAAWDEKMALELEAVDR